MGWTHWAISRSSQCSTTGVTKTVVCASRGTEKMAPEKMAPEKMSPEKMAPGINGTRKKWHYVNLEKMAPYLFYGLLQSMGKLIATCHKTSHESMFEFLLIAIYFKHTQL